MCAQVFVDAGIGEDGKVCIVVRAGRFGCLVTSAEYQEWKSVEFVVATTSAETPRQMAEFVGAFGYALSTDTLHDVVKAVQVAMKAASCCVG